MVTVIKDLGYRKKPENKRAYRWVLVRCSYCNGEVEILYDNVRQNQSCGCVRYALSSAGIRTHGASKTGKREVLYTRWTNIKQRCYNPKSTSYPYYGARGIQMCDEWHDYAKFEAWCFTNGYAPDLELDRVDVDGAYSPTNCRFVTPAVNSRNRRGTKYDMALARAIRQDRAAGMMPKTIAEKRGCPVHAVKNVLYGKAWREDAVPSVAVDAEPLPVDATTPQNNNVISCER